MTQCYMCNSDGISKEHVPPLCIFPESKDLPPGINYRKNLIIVPACKEHNLKKSSNDEYLLFVTVSNWNTNDIGLRQWRTKVLRAIAKRNSKLKIFNNLRPVRVDNKLTGAFDLDIDRFSNEMDMVSRGIFFHHFGKQWFGSFDISSPAAIKTTEPDPSRYNERVVLLTDMISKKLEQEPIRGENPEVFKYRYQYGFEENEYYFILQMVFYEYFIVSSSSPSHRKKGTK